MRRWRARLQSRIEAVTGGDSGAIHVDDTTVTVAGTVVPEGTCGKPILTPFYNVGPETQLIIDIGLTNEEPCDNCTEFFEYEGTVELSSHPSTVKLVHSAGTNGELVAYWSDPSES